MMEKEITVKIILRGKNLQEWEDGKLSLIDEISNALNISQEDVDVFQFREVI